MVHCIYMYIYSYNWLLFTVLVFINIFTFQYFHFHLFVLLGHPTAPWHDGHSATPANSGTISYFQFRRCYAFVLLLLKDRWGQTKCLQTSLIVLPPDSNQVGADQQHQAGGDEAPGRNCEKHQKTNFCLNEIIAPYNKVWVVCKYQVSQLS